MDIILEGSKIDGVETARRIHSRCEVPIIFVTAFADEQTLERVKKTQPFGYIIKPFNEKELWSTIEIALYRHKAEQEIKKRDSILFAISFAVEWFLKNKKTGNAKETSEQGRLEAGIREILEHIDLAVNANSVAIFKMFQDTEGVKGAKIQYSWIAPGSVRKDSRTEPDQITLSTSLWRSLLSMGNTIAGDV